MQELIVKFEAEILRLKWLTAFTNLETAARRYALAQKREPRRENHLVGKAGFRPDQLRVPAGNPDGGQWTHEGGDSGGDSARIWLASDQLPEAPKRPRDPKVRRRTAKELIRNLAELGRAVRRGSLVGWLLEFEPEIRAFQDPPKSFLELSERALGPSEPGYQNHHIAEQDAARRAGFQEELIESTINIVRIPTWKHEQITAWYQTKSDRFGGLSPRQYLQDKDWDERMRLGLEALIMFKVLKP